MMFWNFWMEHLVDSFQSEGIYSAIHLLLRPNTVGIRLGRETEI